MEDVYYKVANHTFRLRLNEDDFLREALTAYIPFLISGADATAPVFTLSVAGEEAKPDYESLLSMGRFDGDGTCLELFHTPDGGRLFLISPQSRGEKAVSYLHISPDYRVATLSFSSDLAPPKRPFAVSNALMLLYAFTTATLGTLLIHASVIVNDGKGYVFLGRSGTGKSTHTRLWLDSIKGSELLNDDNPVIRIENGLPYIYGTPWSGKTPCYRNERAPLGGIVRLSQAPQNNITPLKSVSAYAALSPSLSGMKWEREMADGIHATLTRLIESAPFYHLQCLPNEAAAMLSAQTLKGGTPCAE